MGRKLMHRKKRCAVLKHTIIPVAIDDISKKAQGTWAELIIDTTIQHMESGHTVLNICVLYHWYPCY